MKYKLVAVKDLAVQAFMPPTTVQHVGAAIREFTQAANDSKHHFNMHAKDYELYEIGSFDDSTGSLLDQDSPSSPTLLCRAIDVKLPS